jgi:hypothetical protein
VYVCLFYRNNGKLIQKLLSENIVTKNAGNILSQLLDKKNEKSMEPWSTAPS